MSRTLSLCAQSTVGVFGMLMDCSPNGPTISVCTRRRYGHTEMKGNLWHVWWGLQVARRIGDPDWQLAVSFSSSLVLAHRGPSSSSWTTDPT